MKQKNKNAKMGQIELEKLVAEQKKLINLRNELENKIFANEDILFDNLTEEEFFKLKEYDWS